ncbi:hypothetical protein Plhal304r1_c015g0055411 [Plasmopara halstedii]
MIYSGSDGVEAYTVASHTVVLEGFHLWQILYSSLKFGDLENRGTNCYSDTSLLRNRTC